MKKIILITGAARGIGKGILEELVKDKNNIIIANYNKSEKEALELKEKYGESIELYKADVGNRAEVKKMKDFVINKYKKIDVIINNAGISQIKMFNDITEEDWNRMLQINLTSAYYIIQEFLSNMINEKKGCIINISSIWGITGGACEVHYSAAKAGLQGMTKALAKELGPSNIRVNCIAPGIIDTDMNSKLNEQDIEKIKEEIPLEKIGKPENITSCVKWLIEDEYTTGQTIQINGGWAV